MSGYSASAQRFIARKIKKLRSEGKDMQSSIGEAMGMARQKGMKVPTKKENKYGKK